MVDMVVVAMDNKQRILDISKKLGLSHIGSCLSVLPILEEIYAKKKPEDIVILDNAHAHLAHLVIRHEEVYKNNNDWVVNKDFVEQSIERYGIHCDRKAGCDASGGSLGHGLGIGIGRALANPEIMIYVIVSDGSIMEGSNWEALRIANYMKIKNLEIHCNFNGYTAVSKVDPLEIWNRLNFYEGKIFLHQTDNGEGFEGVAGHYTKL